MRRAVLPSVDLGLEEAMREWNEAIDYIEKHLTGELSGEALAAITMTSEYHFRRMFATLAGMPVSEYIRRRRLSVATGQILDGRGVLEVAVDFGYGSSETFSRAFKALHGVAPSQARRPGARLRSQPQLRFHLHVEGSTHVDYRIVESESFRLAGFSTRVPLVHTGANTAIEDFEKSLDKQTTDRLHSLSHGEPSGPLAVSINIDDPRAEGTMLDYWHAVVTTDPVPEEFETMDVPAGTWVVFETQGTFPEALQQLWADAASEWFPANPYLWARGPELLKVEYLDADTCRGELWLPIERAN